MPPFVVGCSLYFSAKCRTSMMGNADRDSHVLTDASKRAQTGEGLQRTLAMEAIFNHMTEGLVIFDPQGHLLDMNPAALAIHGFESVEGLRRHLDTLTDTFELYDLAGNALPTEAWPIGRALRGETFDRYDVRVVRLETGKTWIGSYGGAPVFDADGDLLLALVTLRDITAEWEAEQALTRAKKQIDTALTATEVGVWHWDVQHNLMVGDRNLLRLFGLEQDEDVVPLETYIDRLHEDDRDRVVDAVKHVLTEGGAYSEEYRILRPDGEVRWILARGRVEIDERGRPASFPGVAVDVTDRRRAEEALRESEERFRVMADGLPFIVWVHDAEGNQEFVNRTFAEFFGVSADEMTGDKWQALMHPEDGPAYLEEFLQCARDQRHFHATVRVRRADGAWRAIESHGRPRLSESGEFQGFVGASIDVTERLEAERAVRRLNRTLERRVAERTADLEERNKELQHFAYIASHDLREPLRKIRAFGDLLQNDAQDKLSEEADFYIQRMRSSASRMDDLLTDLLAFSRIATHTRPFTPVHVRQAISDAVEDYDLKISELDAVVDVQATGAVDADGSQLRQLMSNLIDNALKFRREGVEPRLRVHASVQPALEDASEEVCRIVVEDNGIGFDEKYLDRIFEPFERLHGRSDYEGNGMGLAICRRIVQRHRGNITAESVPGEGSRFIVTLPVRRP